MTTDYTYVAAYDVRNVLWEEFKNAGILNEQDYYPDGFDEPLIPIVPAQQIPEFNNLLPGKPYLTYNVIQKNYGVQWWMSQESMIFEVISRDSAQIQTIINFMVDLFRRYDLAAQGVNVQLAQNSPYDFFYFKIDTTDPIQPFTDEGGYMSGDITIHYSYTRNVDPNTGRFA